MASTDRPDRRGPPAPKSEPEAAERRGADEDFVSRWSRRKQQSRAEAAAPTPPAAPAEPPLPELPPLASLTPESDFSLFMHPKVDDALRRTALKTLFRDPRYNVMDGLDIYIDDYSVFEPITPDMLAKLTHTVEHLVNRKPEANDGGAGADGAPTAADAEPARLAEAPATPASDVAPPSTAPAEQEVVATGDAKPGERGRSEGGEG